jgi:hypothetical protein
MDTAVTDMHYVMPSCSDQPLWDLWLGSYVLPCVTAADEAGLFDALAATPATAAEAAARLNLQLRALEVFLPVLASRGFLALRLGRYHLTDVSRNYLLRSSPFYWGGVLQSGLLHSPMHVALKAALTASAAPAAKAYEALPAGARIYLHEMLLDDDGAGPPSAAGFSVVMLFGTEGRQYSGSELRTLLRGAGFSEPQIRPASPDYSLVCAHKP